MAENQNNLRMERLSVVRHRQLKSVSIGIDSNKKVAEKHLMREGIPKGNHDFFGVVSLWRTLTTFFREKVVARRAGETTKSFECIK